MKWTNEETKRKFCQNVGPWGTHVKHTFFQRTAINGGFLVELYQSQISHAHSIVTVARTLKFQINKFHKRYDNANLRVAYWSECAMAVFLGCFLSFAIHLINLFEVHGIGNMRIENIQDNVLTDTHTHTFSNVRPLAYKLRKCRARQICLWTQVSGLHHV